MLAILLLAALATEPSASVPPPTFTAAEIRREITTDSSLATVQALWRAGRWVVVENGVASGDADWVALAPLVAPGTDAGASEGLSIALADALPKAPDAVLGVLTEGGGGPLDVARVCSAPFIEDTPKHHVAYVQAAVKALDRPLPPKIRPAGQACLTRLRQVR